MLSSRLNYERNVGENVSEEKEKIDARGVAKAGLSDFPETLDEFWDACDALVACRTEAVDAVIVVGGYNSGNTRRLAEIARQTGKPTYHIESESELASMDTHLLASARHIGITASGNRWTHCAISMFSMNYGNPAKRPGRSGDPQPIVAVGW